MFAQPPRPRAIAQHILIDLEVPPELLGERAHPEARHRDDEVDVVSRAGLALEGACDASAQEVLAPDRIEGGRDKQRDVERDHRHGSVSPPSHTASSGTAPNSRTAAARP